MRIAVDARELAGHPTGVGRYLSELVARWHTSPDARRHQWHFFAHRPVPLPAGLEGSLSVLPGHGGSRWEQGALSRALRRDKPDVLFAPGYTAPLTTPAPIALTVHDVSFAAHPEWFSFREGLRRRMLTKWAARRARTILTDSAFSRDEIVKHIGLAADRVRIIPPGISRRTELPTAPRERMILFVGSIFRRRHVDTLIEVFAHHVASRLPESRLEIVGENRMHPPADLAAIVRRTAPDVARRIRLRSYVDEHTLNELYARATVFAFLSEYEGFGFTPLEALSAGVPPVVLDTAVAREIYGEAARYVRGLSSPQLLAETLIDLLTSESARSAVLQHRDLILARYDWHQTASATLRAIEEAAGA